MPMVQGGELLCDLENVFLSYLSLNLYGASKESSLVQRAMLRHSSEGSHYCWRGRGRAQDPDNSPCQSKDLSTSHVDLWLNTRHL